MKLSIQKTAISGALLFAAPAISLLITPFASLDPINIPKMTLLVLSASFILGVLFSNARESFFSRSNILIVISIFFIIQLAIVVIFAPGVINQQIYGTFGRNTGFLTYLSLLVFTFGAFFASSYGLILRFMYTLIGTGLIAGGYGLLQTIGLDPIGWNNPFNPIVGFLGNPNFASSFLGICSVAIVGYLFQGKTIKLKIIVVALIYLVLLLVLIIRSNSQQGIIVFGIGFSVVTFLYLLGTPKLVKTYVIIPFLVFLTIISSLVGLAMLNQGPLAQYIYKLSVRQRGFYWDAALEMMNSHPLTGVGLDSYGDWYFGVRSDAAALYTPTTMSDDAHNVFLNFGANGGYPLLILYLLLHLYTVVSILKFVRWNRHFNWSYSALVGCWIAFTAQSIISLNQIGLSVWGWIMMGLILGIQFHGKNLKIQENAKAEVNLKNSLKLKQNNVRIKILSIGIIGVIFGLILALPPFLADSRFKSSLQSQVAEDFMSSALAYPQDVSKIVQAAQVLARSNLLDQSESMIDLAISINSRNYNAWEIKLAIEKAKDSPSSVDIEIIKDKLRYLNPKVVIE